MAVGPNVFNCPRCKEQVFLHTYADLANDCQVIKADCKCQNFEKTFPMNRWLGLFGHAQQFWAEFVKKLPKDL